jgi:hypothetical protein
MASEDAWRRELQLAGSGDLEAFAVEAVQVSDQWRRPSFLGIDGDRLLWALDEPEPVPEAAARGLLAAFCAIKDKRGAVRVARRFGPLGLCEHGHFRGPGWPRPTSADEPSPASGSAAEQLRSSTPWGPTWADAPTLSIDARPRQPGSEPFQPVGLDWRCCPDPVVKRGPDGWPWAVGESLEAWLKYARWLRAALTVYALLKQREPIPADE